MLSEKIVFQIKKFICFKFSNFCKIVPIQTGDGLGSSVFRSFVVDTFNEWYLHSKDIEQMWKLKNQQLNLVSFGQWLWHN